MLTKLNKLKNWQAALIITLLGFATYFDGLRNQFLGDDFPQIVNNIPVHSIANFRLFFEGGTFYVSNGLAPLYGPYFRPLMTTTFSLLYTLFGSNPFYFHLLQLLICIGGSILLYLLFRYSFKSLLALILAAIFLIHPLDSQVVYEIASLQDALYFFFGVLALYLLFRFKSIKSLFVVAVCLFLSLIAKETGVLFIIMSLIYLFWYNRRRLYPFIGSLVMPIGLYLLLKTHAVGLLGTNPNNAPIDSLALAGRLFTAPSIILFYLIQFILPIHLAHAYYWVDPTFSVTHFLLPLVVDLAIATGVVYLTRLVHKRTTKSHYFAFLFFAIWSGLGLLLHLQIVPLDFTANESWFYFSMAGVLGMIGIVITTFGKSIRFDSRALTAVVSIVIVLLGVRTIMRGPDWSSTLTLAYADVKVSKTDYVSDNLIATDKLDKGELYEGIPYAQRSVSIYPQNTNYNTLGQLYFKLGEYNKAEQAFLTAIEKQGNPSLFNQIYDNTAGAMILQSPTSGDTLVFITQSLSKYPNDPMLWLYLAAAEYKSGSLAAAQGSITKAFSLDQSNQISTVYYIIMNNKPLPIN